MKFVVFTDLHLTNSSSKFRFNSEGVSDLLQRQFQFVDDMCSATEQDVDGFLFLGDYSDHCTLDPVTATYANRVMRRLVDTEKPLVLIGGNHTISDARSRFSVLGALSELVDTDRVHIVTHVDVLSVGDCNFWCFPYQSDYDDLQKRISDANQDLNPEFHNYMLFHFPINNALLDNGVPMPSGVELRQEMVDRFDMVLGGDFHRGQRLGLSTPAYYIGAPFDLKFNQYSDFPRGYAILDTDRNELTHYANPHNVRMVSMDADDVTHEMLDSIDAPNMILRVKGTLEPATELELREMPLYSFSNPKARKPKIQRKDVLLVDETNKDEHHVRQMLSDYELSPTVRDRVIELFASLQSKGDR